MIWKGAGIQRRSSHLFLGEISEQRRKPDPRRWPALSRSARSREKSSLPSDLLEYRMLYIMYDQKCLFGLVGLGLAPAEYVKRIGPVLYARRPRRPLPGGRHTGRSSDPDNRSPYRAPCYGGLHLGVVAGVGVCTQGLSLRVARDPLVEEVAGPAQLRPVCDIAVVDRPNLVPGETLLSITTLKLSCRIRALLQE